MRKLLFLFLLVVCWCPGATAQQGHVVDSLLRIFNAEQDNGRKALLAGTIAQAYGTADVKEMHAYAMQQLSLARKVGDKADEANAYCNLADAAIFMGWDSIGARQYDTALKIFTAINDKKEMANCQSKIGSQYYDHGLLQQALPHFLKALTYAEESGDRVTLGYVYIALHAFYKGSNNQVASLQYARLAMDCARASCDAHLVGSAYNALGDLFERTNNLDSALYCYKAAVNVMANGPRKYLRWPYYNVGEVYMFRGAYDSALYYYQLTMDIQRYEHDMGGVAWTKNNIANMLMKQGNYRGAEQYALNSLDTCIKLNDPGGAANARRTLFMIYEAMGDYKTALQYHKAMLDDLKGQRDVERAKDLLKQQMQYDFAKQQAQEKAATNRREMLAVAIGVFMVLVIVAVIIAYRLQRRSATLKDELITQKEIALSNQEMLMKEMHHRVKNNLQVIGTLLELQVADMHDAAARAALGESTARIGAISLIHHQLYRDNNIATIEFGQFVTDLHQQVSIVFDNGFPVTLYNEIPILMLDVDTSVPLALILNELLTNSYKYAFGKGGGTINVALSKVANGYIMRYQDSGPGLPDNINADEIRSLGMTLIKNLSRQIGGLFSYVKETRTFVITFRSAADMKRSS